MRYRTFLWDLDGTLTDPKEGITRSVQYALHRLNRPCPPLDDLEWVIGPPLRQALQDLLATDDPALAGQALSLYRQRYGETGMYENTPYPGIAGLLADIQARGGHNVLATAKPLVFAEKILAHFQLERYFSLIMGSGLNGEFVEKPDLIQEILRRLPEADRHTTVMIGDRRYDVEGARQNGIDVISVAYGYGSLPELHAAAPDGIALSVDHLRELLLGKHTVRQD